MKDITITTSDDIAIKNDKIKIEDTAPDILSQLIEKFDIKLENINNTPKIKTKPIPKEWIPEIINEGIKVSKYAPDTISSTTNSFVLVFSNDETVIKFFEDFRFSLQNKITDFIVNKNLNPKEYNRSLVITTLIEKKVLSMGF